MDTEIKREQLKEMLSNPIRSKDGFRILMKQYGHQLYWHIRRIVVGHEDAEDILQEVCIKIFESIKTYRGEGDITAWIYRIATNESLRHLKKQTHLFQSIDTLGNTLTEKLETETSMDSHSVEVLFQKALLTLPTQQRIAFNMRYYDELSYDEISQITGKKIGTLKTNYHYATDKIKQYIKDHTQ